MFNKDSGLVKIWVKILLQANTQYTINDIPNIDNLKEIVLSLMEK